MAGSRKIALAAVVLGVLLAGCGASIMPQIHNEADRIIVARRMYDKGEYAVVVELLNSYTTTGTGSADRIYADSPAQAPSGTSLGDLLRKAGVGGDEPSA